MDFKKNTMILTFAVLAVAMVTILSAGCFDGHNHQQYQGCTVNVNVAVDNNPCDQHAFDYKVEMIRLDNDSSQQCTGYTCDGWNQVLTSETCTGTNQASCTGVYAPGTCTHSTTTVTGESCSATGQSSCQASGNIGHNPSYPYTAGTSTCTGHSQVVTGYTCTEDASCPSHYSLQNGVCKRSGHSDQTPTCPSGYSLDGNNCVKTITSGNCPSHDDQKDPIYGQGPCNQYSCTGTVGAGKSCPSGYSKQDITTQTCDKYTCTASGQTSCPGGFTASGQQYTSGDCNHQTCNGYATVWHNTSTVVDTEFATSLQGQPATVKLVYQFDSGFGGFFGSYNWHLQWHDHFGDHDRIFTGFDQDKTYVIRVSDMNLDPAYGSPQSQTKDTSVCGGGITFHYTGSIGINLQDSDNLNCGACDNVCTGGKSCSEGTCVCPEDQTSVGGVCYNLGGDNGNCGSVGHVCPVGQSCSGGQCVCPEGQLSCSNVCVIPQNDNGNCGACGNVCGGGQSCVSGACACPEGLTLVNGACDNLQTDPNNCGSVGNVCPEDQSCSAGVCSGGGGFGGLGDNIPPGPPDGSPSIQYTSSFTSYCSEQAKTKAPALVTFVDHSTNYNRTDAFWDFGDGNAYASVTECEIMLGYDPTPANQSLCGLLLGTVTEVNPAQVGNTVQHLYTNPGTYQVTLRDTWDLGAPHTETLPMTNHVTVDQGTGVCNPLTPGEPWYESGGQIHIGA